MKRERITSSNIKNIRLDSTCAAVYIYPTADPDIDLEYSTYSGFHVTHEVTDKTLRITAEVGRWKRVFGTDPVIRVYIPEAVIEKLSITGSASFVHLEGQENMFRTCQIDVTVAAIYMENIYGDIRVKTISGAIRMKNQTIQSNIHLETQVGVIDMTLDQLPDNVALQTRGTVQKNNYFRTRNSEISEILYSVKVESLLGVIHIH